MCRTAATGRRLRRRGPAAWRRWRQRSFWKSMGTESRGMADGSTMTALEENLEKLEEAIGAACRRAGRGRGEVELMAVSKTYPAETLAVAAGLGLRLFGENRVQEFSAKALRAAE